MTTYDKAKGPEEGPAADVWIIRPWELGRVAAAGMLQPVPDSLVASTADYNWQDLLPLYQYKLLLWDGVPCALPLMGEGYLCFYRDDLFSQPGHRAEFKKKVGRELSAPATWEEFAQIAEFFANRKWRASELPSPSLPPMPEDDESLDREFYSVAVPFSRRGMRGMKEGVSHPQEDELFSFHYDLKTGEPRLASAGFVEALRLIRRLQKCRPPGTIAQPEEAFAQGKAVLCLAETSWLGRFQKPDSLVRGKFNVCQVPGADRVFDYRKPEFTAVPDGNYVPYLGAGGWLAVVPRQSEHSAFAFEFLRDLSGVKISSDIAFQPTWGGGPFRRRHFDNRIGWDIFELGAAHTSTLIQSLRQTVTPPIINPVVRLRTPDQGPHAQALDQELRSFLSAPDGVEAGAALAKAADRWRLLDQTRDLSQRKRDYRLSISLKP